MPCNREGQLAPRVCANFQFAMKVNKLLRIPLLLTLAVFMAALVVVVMAAATGTAAHAQSVDQSLPPLADLSIDAEIEAGDDTGWIVTVKANRVGRHPLARVRDVKVRFSVESVSPSPQISGLASPLSVGLDLTSIGYLRHSGSYDKSSMIWTIDELGRSSTSPEAVAVASVGSPNVPAISGPVVVRVNAEIIGSDPAEPPVFNGNNAVAMLSASESGGRGDHPHGDAGVLIYDISDRFPNVGGTTTFTVLAVNESRRYSPQQLGSTEYYSTQLGVQLRIELSPGLTFAGTPTAPSGTTYSATTGIWDVGTLETGGSNAKSLPVTVNLTSDSLDDLPLEKRCLTAEVISAVPGFASDLSKRENDIATACLGRTVEWLSEGDVNLFDYVDCVGVTTTPCTSMDSLELRGGGSENDERIVHVSEPEGRHGSTHSAFADTIWSTGAASRHSSSAPQIEGVGVSFRFISSGWSAYRWELSDVSPKQRPGALKIIHGSTANRLLVDADTTTSLGPFNLGSTTTRNPYPAFVTFGTLGTYKINLTVGATKSGTAYSGTETYTFHVGPAADLEVRDAGASPAVAADRQAYTVMAVNNGPSEPSSVRVTGLPTGVTEFTASEGEYDPASGVWTIGRLRVGDYRASGLAYEAPTLTLITGDAAGSEITAEIESADYCVRIKTGATDPANDLECAGSLPTGYTEHSVAYYDHIGRNNSAPITARAGTGEGVPGAPQSVEAMATRLGNILTWQPVERVNGFEVIHYQVQRSASPWETLPKTVTVPMYLDMAASGNPSYRVRAVNIFGVPGPWSEPSARRPGVPREFSATIAAGNTQINLSWGAPGEVTGVTVSGYDVEYLDGATWTSLASGQSALTYDHTGLTLTPGAVWQYRARTVGDDGGEKVMSEWATASVTVADPRPGGPQGLHCQRRQRHQGQPVLERARRRDPRDPHRLRIRVLQGRRQHLGIAGEPGGNGNLLHPHPQRPVARRHPAVPRAGGGKRDQRRPDGGSEGRLGLRRGHEGPPDAGRSQGLHGHRRQRRAGQPGMERSRRRDRRDRHRLRPGLLPGRRQHLGLAGGGAERNRHGLRAHRQQPGGRRRPAVPGADGGHRERRRRDGDSEKWLGLRRGHQGLPDAGSAPGTSPPAP